MRAIALAVAIILLTGCPKTRDHGEMINRRIDKLDKRVKELEARKQLPGT
jgi:hypothetical protein